MNSTGSASRVQFISIITLWNVVNMKLEGSRPEKYEFLTYRRTARPGSSRRCSGAIFT